MIEVVLLFDWRLHLYFKLTDEEVLAKVLFYHGLNEHMSVPHWVEGGLVFHTIHIEVLEILEKPSWVNYFLKGIFGFCNSWRSVSVGVNQVWRVYYVALKKVFVGILDFKSYESRVRAIDVRDYMGWSHKVDIIGIGVNIHIIDIIIEIQMWLIVDSLLAASDIDPELPDGGSWVKPIDFINVVQNELHWL